MSTKKTIEKLFQYPFLQGYRLHRSNRMASSAQLWPALAPG